MNYPNTKFSRKFSMPSRWTFSMKPVATLLETWLGGEKVVVDPFCGNSSYASYANDLAKGGVDARKYLDNLIKDGLVADVVLIDPPYSPRQISECYKSVGLKVSSTDTQNAVLYKEVKNRADLLLREGGIAICFGWNSGGMGKGRGYVLDEVLMVNHGGAHNDTIVTVEHKDWEILD